MNAVTDASNLSGAGPDYPVFILGSPRSGTSTLAHVFAEHFGYRGFPEGHLFNLLHRLSGVVREHFIAHGIFEQSRKVASDAVPEKAVRPTTSAQAVGLDTLLEALERMFHAEVRRALGTSWFDKTPGPEAIHGVGLVRRLYPNARYIFLIRDGISNIESRLRKFPGVAFQDHCRAWVECAYAWMKLRADLKPGTYLELRTHELTTEPQRVYRQLVQLIEGHPLGREAALKPPLTRFLVLERTASDDPSATRSLDDVNWSDADKQTFLAICAEVMEAFGFDATTTARSDPARVLPPPHGQPDVVITKGDYGGVWPQVHNDEMWIFMHPSAIGSTPTTLTYRNVVLDGVARIRSRMTVISELAPPVRFVLELREPGAGEVLETAAFVCGPMQEQDLEFAMPA